ncbi:MAG: PAS domain-containing protein [Deltaproteobacteria bacterium]|nr:PAS domain-containing protein [Deltaproteobacteria bacterium]
MFQPSDDAVRNSPEVGAAFNRLLIRRARVGLLLGCAAVVAFVTVNHLGRTPMPRWTDVMNLSVALGLAAALIATTYAAVQRHIIALMMLAVTLASAVRALAGTWHGDVAPSAIFLVVMAMTAASILAWGFWPQIFTAVVAGIAAALNAYLVTGGFGPPPGHAAAAVALGLAGSVILAVEMRRHHLQLFVDNLRRRQAEAALAQLNAQLEQRVEERTAQLAAATRDLEREVHERQQAAADLRESQRRLQAVLDHADVAIYLRDLDGRYLVVNRYWLALAGRTAEEVIGLRMEEVLPPDVVAGLRAHDDEVLAAPHSLQFEESIPQLDGWHTFVSVKFAWHRDDGTPVGIWGLSTDITERKHAEAELRRSEAALTAVLENTSDAIWALDRHGAVTVMNAAARRRFAAREAGVPVVPSGDAGGEFGQLYARALAGHHVELGYTVPGAGGDESYLTAANPIVEDGAVVGVTVISKDITQLRRAEQAAREHQAELAHVLRLSTMGEMASGLAHEINQPLGAIANYAQGCARRLRNGTADVETLLPVIDKIGAEALRAGEVIRRLRDLVRKEEPRQAPADLNLLVRETLRLVEPEARERNVRIQLELAPALPPISCNDIQIEQVLLNLLLNGVEAVEASPNGVRRVTVATAAVPNGVEVAVSDSGAGLPDPPVDVFKPFFTTKPDGLGMGLSISRSIIEAHGGQLSATRNPERGSTFRFVLPHRA